MPNRHKHGRRNRRGGRFWGVYLVFTALLIGAVVIGGSIVFFKVNTFDLRLKTTSGNVVCLEGNSRYTEEEIIDASGIQYWDNLCLINKASVASRLLGKLSYVSSVNISRHLPGTLMITITESQPVAAIQGDKTWYIIDADGKILESSGEKPDMTIIQGLTLQHPQVGSIFQVPTTSSEDEEEGTGQTLQRESLLKLLPALVGHGVIEEITSIDLSPESVLLLHYQDRLTVKLRVDADFEYQTKLLKSILEEYISVNWTESDTGTLDMTYGDGQTRLTKDDA